MIIGDGDIAKVLRDREDRLYFASGVSNSKETRKSEYEREKALLLDQDKHRHLVYFSSLSIFYTDTLYAQHKRRMEDLIKKTFRHWTIVRIGNITWGTNPNTIINFMRARHAAGETLEIRDAYRYVVDQEEFLHWINMIPDWNCEINITGRKMSVQEIVDQYVLNQDRKN